MEHAADSPVFDARGITLYDTSDQGRRVHDGTRHVSRRSARPARAEMSRLTPGPAEGIRGALLVSRSKAMISMYCGRPLRYVATWL